MVGASQKKVRDFEAKNGSDGTPATPTKATPKKNLKRKIKAEVNEDVVDEGYGELPVSPKTATPRKRARPVVKKEELDELSVLVPEQPQGATEAVREREGAELGGVEEEEQGEEKEQEYMMEYGQFVPKY